MTLDNLPIHLGLVFQVLVLTATFLILWQIDRARVLDNMRHHEGGAWFTMRTTMMFVKALALAWTVIYSHARDWQPWPPIVMFLLAFDVYVFANVMVIRADIRKLRERQAATPPQRSPGIRPAQR